MKRSMEATIAIAVEAGDGLQVETWRVRTMYLPSLRYWLTENRRRTKTYLTAIKRKKHSPSQPAVSAMPKRQKRRKRRRLQVPKRSYPGLTFLCQCRTKPWRAQIIRKKLKWHEDFATIEEAQAALAAKITEFGLRPIRLFKQKKTTEKVIHELTRMNTNYKTR